MDWGTNAGSDIRFLFKCLAGAHKRKGIYLGHTWFKNLGDEALREAIYALFDNYLIMVQTKGFLVRTLEKWGWIRFDVLMLGGGTLIFRSLEALNAFEQERPLIKMVYGTGVEEPEFLKHMDVNGGDPARWAKALSRAHYISVRGPRSKRMLLDQGLRKPVDLIGDPVLNLIRPLQDARTPGRKMGVNIGLTGIGEGRGLLWGMDERKFFEVFADFLKLMDADGWAIEFVSVCAEDMDAIEEVIAMSKTGNRIRIFKDYRSAQKTLDKMQEFDVFVGQKLHSVVLAYCANTPAVMVEYRPKCRDFMESIQMEEFNVRTDRFEKHAVKAMTEKLVQGREQYRAKTNRICIHYKNLLEEAAVKVSHLFI